MIFYYMIWLISCFLIWWFHINMVIISKMDTQHNIWYLPSESNHVMSTNGKVSDLLIIMLITVPLAPTAGALFTTNTILLHILSLFKNCCFNYLKTENHKEDLCLKIYALSLAILICYFLLHFKKHKILDQESTESTLRCCARSRRGSDKYTPASWKADVLESATQCFCSI